MPCTRSYLGSGVELVFGGRHRKWYAHIRIDRMRAFDPTKEPVVRPDGFVLSDAWKHIADQVNEKRLPMRARCLVSPDRIPMLRARL